jgi:hypothetical protein
MKEQWLRMFLKEQINFETEFLIVSIYFFNW